MEGQSVGSSACFREQDGSRSKAACQGTVLTAAVTPLVADTELKAPFAVHNDEGHGLRDLTIVCVSPDARRSAGPSTVKASSLPRDDAVACRVRSRRGQHDVH